MALSHELISQFAKLVNNNKNTTNVETTIYGTVVVDDKGNKYVKPDESDQLIPFTDKSDPNLNRTTVAADEGERVSVLIKNHTATVTGNVSSPAAKDKDVNSLVQRLNEFDIIIAEQIQANSAYFKKLLADEVIAGKIEAGEMTVAEATIASLIATEAEIDSLIAGDITAKNLITTKLKVDSAQALFATVENFTATNAAINALSAEYGTFKDLHAKQMTAVDAQIKDLEAKTAEIDKLDTKYANIDFGNITEATIRNFFTKTGMIENVIIGDSTVTGALVGVTIKGDLIEAGTVKADKLVIKSSKDGLYYKLNIEAGAVASAEVTEEELQNGLSGTAIIAKTITAEKIDVKDLVAFGATIGGFKITSDAIHSQAKPSADATTRGFYVDNDGQMAVGDATRFLRYYKVSDENGNETYRFELAADSITFGANKTSVEEAINTVTQATNVNTENLTKYMGDTDKALEDLQGQIDGAITTWFYEYVPTADNIPASEWTTTDLKNNHLGDLFYDTITGYCYRWQVRDNKYDWNLLKDADVTKALQDAAAAQDTADKKRRVFFDTPVPPYDKGDLWSQGSSGDMMICLIAKTKNQSYALADWAKASKYTDDTAANKAQADAAAAQKDADALKVRMASAETAIEQSNEAIALRATKKEVEETYATKQEVEDIEIGGRNLLQNSSMKKDLNFWETQAVKIDGSSATGDVLEARKTVFGAGAFHVDDVTPNPSSATVQLSSKNIWRFEDMKLLVGAPLKKTETGFISYGGVGTAFYSRQRWMPISALDGMELTLSVNIAPSGKNRPGLLIRYISEDEATKVAIVDKMNTIGDFSCTFKIDSANAPTCKYVELLFYSQRGVTDGLTENDTVEWTNLQIEKGTTPTAYTPYTIPGQKNLFFTNETLTRSNGGLTLTTTKDTSSFILNGTATADSAMGIASKVPLDPGTYTVSLHGANVVSTSSYYDRIYIRYVNNNGNSDICNNIMVGIPRTFTINTAQEVEVHLVFGNGSTYENKEVSVQIEAGDKPSAYKPYRYGKNLLPYPYGMTTITTNGITFTDNGDGTVTANGTATGTANVYFYAIAWGHNYKMSPGTYVFKSISKEEAEVARTNLAFRKNGTIIYDKVENGETLLVDLPEGADDIYFHMTILKGKTVENLTFKPQLERGTVVTPYTPYWYRAPDVKMIGKNIWRLDDMYFLAGRSIAKKTENGIVVSSTSSGTWLYGIYRWLPIKSLDGVTITLSCNMIPSGSNKPLLIFRMENEDRSIKKDIIEMTRSGSVSYTVDAKSLQEQGLEYFDMLFYSNASSTTSASGDYVEYSNFQIEICSTATEYEKPKEPVTYTVDENGVVEIDQPVSPSMTLISDVGIGMDLTYTPISGFVTKLDRPCLCINQTEFETIKTVHQDILGKIDRDSTYVLSGWFLIENLTRGTTNPFLKLYIDGYYDDEGTRTWYHLGSFDIPNTAGEWQRVSGIINGSNLPETATTCMAYVHTRDITGQVYFYNLKLEKGNKVTDWTPAPEDVDSSVSDLHSEINEVNNSIEDRAATVTENALVSYNEALNDIRSSITEIQEFNTELTVGPESIVARVEKTEATIKNGEFDTVKVSGKNYIMDDTGFTIEDLDKDKNTIKTTISNNGMVVESEKIEMLKANADGVIARKLTAKVYLTIGENSRFEDYNGNRTACFWIGN